MKASDCPFDHTCFDTVCSERQRVQADADRNDCEHRPSCITLKEKLRLDPDSAVSVTKAILLNGLPLQLPPDGSP